MKQNKMPPPRKSGITIGDFTVNFVRTCRVLEGKVNALPAGLGNFQVYNNVDFKSAIPSDWNPEGFFMPMYTQEALWLNFPKSFQENKLPSAAIIAAGNINAVTCKQIQLKKNGTLDMQLEETQNYVVVPPQPWLDGWKDKDDKIYQFVAAQMGSGQTVESQITGEEKFGGIQIAVFESLKKYHDDLKPLQRPREHTLGLKNSFESYSGNSLGSMLYCCNAKSATKNLSASPRSMGLGRGGEIKQKIYPDSHGLHVWKKSPTGIIQLYMVNSEDFKQITSQAPPPTPVTHELYQKQGIPWFELPDVKMGDTQGSDIFKDLNSVKY
ncbi:hypothetical protein HON01_05005 [Candidatus Woesearchaeota archaeon]|nr:hypothetical protein [Candidatus Woesearchaeota archaeon]